MSLSVLAYVRHPNNEVEWLTPQYPFNDLAGFEDSRIHFWASDEVKNLDLILMPCIKDQDVWAEGVELDQLEKEINILIKALPSTIFQQNYEFWHFRLLNIREAIRLARTFGGGVHIG